MDFGDLGAVVKLFLRAFKRHQDRQNRCNIFNNMDQIKMSNVRLIYKLFCLMWIDVIGFVIKISVRKTGHADSQLKKPITYLTYHLFWDRGENHFLILAPSVGLSLK